MSYCPECGSEVANTDTFCAYCGISLQVMSEPPASEPTQPENQPKFGEPEKIQTSASLDKEPINPGEIHGGKSDGPLAPPPPTPFILDESVDSAPVPGVATPPELPLEALDERPEVLDLREDVKPVSEAEVTDVVSETPAETVSSGENRDGAPSSAIDAASGAAENDVAGPTAAPPSVDEFSQTIPYTPSDYAKQDLTFSPVDQMTTPSDALDDEERMRSVLDEIDLNLQAQNEAIAANGPQAEIAPASSEPVSSEIDLAPPVTDAASDAGDPAPKAEEPVQTEAQETVEPPKFVEPYPEPAAVVPVFETGAEPPAAPVAESIPPAEIAAAPAVGSSPVMPEAAPSGDGEKSSENLSEGRSFTNPNMGYGDTDGRNKKKLKPLEEGTILNSRYEVIRKIGGGGMGAVYLANDKNLGGVLRAVKEMVQSYIEDEAQEKAVNDFKRESLLLTSLEHPGIPTIYDYFFDEKEGRFYLVMKYISGGDLAARLRAAPEGRIDEVTVTDWAIQIADVLDYLHNRQPPIVYRDLKPSNIMIDGNTGKVMIIDFGIARWVNKEEKGVTAVGTMGYAPPELFSGNVEPRSDIYSLGSTMFHLLTGADPQSNPLLIFDFNKNPRPRQINPNLSDQMELILMRAVEYNSEQRFASAAEMCEELRKHLENLKKGAITFGVMNAAVSGQPLSNVPVFCGFCGQKIVATDMFCPFCGAQQPLVGQSQKLKAAPTYVSPKPTAKLLILGTSDLEQTEYPLEKDSNLLGRRDPMSNIFPEVDMSKFDPQTKISRKHARIWREGDLYMLEDLGSSNGTILFNAGNDPVRLLPRQPHVLSHGDKLKLGDTTLRFTIG